MMKTIVEINNNNYGSTGNIMMNIANKARENGYTVYTCCKNSKTGKKFIYDNQIFVGLWLERVISEKLCCLTGYKDHFNLLGTLLFINKLKKIKPDIIHFHNIHGSFINIKLLINYINKNNIDVVWTLHDTWSIAGQCTYFDIVNCNKWQTGCKNCPKLNEYPSSIKDKTNYLWNLKKDLFSSINNLTLITPSRWLSSLIDNSFLKDKKKFVINNGIDLNIYKPTTSNFKNKYNINNKFLILGVAYDWSDRKGLNTFVSLSKDLSDEYQIIIVGTNEEVDRTLPNNIISIHKTNTKQELIDIYSACDLFINPTLEENFPTVNIEALACGTPVLTFDTGGSKEMINETCGMAVKKYDYESLLKQIIYIKNNPFKKEACITQASNYNMNDKFNEYIELYNSIINK